MLRVSIFCLLFMSISSVYAEVLDKHWIERASQGYLLSVNVGLGATKDEVLKKIGKPVSQEPYLLQYKNVSFF